MCYTKRSSKFKFATVLPPHRVSLTKKRKSATSSNFYCKSSSFASPYYFRFPVPHPWNHKRVPRHLPRELLRNRADILSGSNVPAPRARFNRLTSIVSARSGRFSSSGEQSRFFFSIQSWSNLIFRRQILSYRTPRPGILLYSSSNSVNSLFTWVSLLFTGVQVFFKMFGNRLCLRSDDQSLFGDVCWSGIEISWVSLSYYELRV